MTTTIIILIIGGLIQQKNFHFLTIKHLNKMSDQNATIEGYVSRINADLTKIGGVLSTVQTELNAFPGGNPLSETTLADLDTAVNALDTLANLPAPAPAAAPAPAEGTE